MTPKNRAVKGRAGSREAPKLATQFPRIHFVGSSVNRSLTGSYHLISRRASRASPVSLRIGPTAPQPRQRARRPSPSESTNMGYRCSPPPLACLALRSETYPVRNAFIATKDIIHRVDVTRLTHFGVFLK